MFKVQNLLANVLSEVGHNVTKEYYVNDAGIQIKSLGLSIWTVRNGGILKEGHADGLLIGRTSLDSEDFSKIIAIANEL